MTNEPDDPREMPDDPEDGDTEEDAGVTALPAPDAVLDDIVAGKPLDLRGLRALAEPSRDVLQRMLGLWKTIPPERRRDVLAALERLDEDEATLDFHRIYLTALRDPDPATRMLAVRGLREQDRAEYMRLLAAQLRDDPVAMVRAEIAEALAPYVVSMEFGLLAEDDAETLTAALRESVEDVDEAEEVRGNALQALGASSEESTAELISETYEVGSPLMRIAAIKAMGRNASEGWLELLVYHFDDDDPDMRAAAAEAAGQLLMEEAVDPLVMLATEDKEQDVQIAAIHALGEIGNMEAERVLNRWLRERRDPAIQDAIRDALAEVQLLTAEMVDGRRQSPSFEDEDSPL
jgi:HEAT repeat protein